MSETGYRSEMSRKILKAIAWGSLAFIVFATLSPIGLRPHFTDPNIERFGAFVMAGLLFGIAYPNRFWPVLAIVLGAACVLEALQLLIPHRHGDPLNAIVKFAGGCLGMTTALLINRLWMVMNLPSAAEARAGTDTT
jgi:hypothetical protein